MTNWWEIKSRDRGRLFYARAARLRRWVRRRWLCESTAEERARTVHAVALARRLQGLADGYANSRAIDALVSALDQLETGTAVHDHVTRAHTALTDNTPPPDAIEAYELGITVRPQRAMAYVELEQAVAAADVLDPVHDQLMTAWAAVRPSPAAMPITLVAEHVVQEMVQAEAAYERERAAFSVKPGSLERATWLRYVHSELRKFEEHEVSAVLARDADDRLIEQVCLLGEQLFWQEQIDTVPHTLTEFAVTPFRKRDGSISADFGIWCRLRIGGYL